MRARGVVAGRIICQQLAKALFPEHHDMVEGFTSHRSDQPFNMTVLPRSERGEIGRSGIPMARSRRVTTALRIPIETGHPSRMKPAGDSDEVGVR